MATLIAIPIFSLLIILQSAIVSRLPLLQGTPDLILLVIIAWGLQERVKSAWQWSIIGGLMIGFVSVIHFSIPLITYLVITVIVLIIKQRIWQAPILAMFVVTFIGSLFNQSVSAIAVSISGSVLPVLDTLRLIILPSLILNLILAVPVFAIVRDIAEWVHPEEIEI